MIALTQIEDYIKVGDFGVYKASLLTYETDDTNQLFRLLYAGQKLISRPIAAFSDANTVQELATFFDTIKSAAISFGGGGSVFGSQYAQVELTDVINTSSEAFIDVLTLDTSNLQNGKYRAVFYCEYSNNKTNRSVSIRCLFGGEVIAEKQKEAKDDTDYYTFNCSVSRDTVGINTIKIQGSVERSNTTLSVRRARIEFYRVS